MHQNLEDDGDFFKVRVQSGQVGWVYLARLDDETDLVDFVGGLIRLFRRDYSGAIDMLSTVAISSRSVMLRVDSLLLQALATEKMRKDPSALIDSALKLDPYLQVSVKFKLLNLISQLQKSPSGSRKAKVAELLKQISENSYLFSPEDSWLDTSKKIVAAVEQE